MNIRYHISPYPALLENMVAKIYEAVSPNAEVDSIVLPETNGAGVPTVGAGHPIPASVTFTGRDKVTHVVRLFTAVGGILLHQYDTDAEEDIVTIFDDIRFKIGDGQPGTPAVGDSAYVNTVLIGLTIDDFRIYRNGYGFLYPSLHYTFNSTSGTVTLIVPPTDNFGNEEEFLVSRKPKAVKTIVNDSVVGKQFGGNATLPNMFIDVTSTVNYDATHLRHLIRLAGVNANYVFPAIAAIPVGYQFRVTNFGAYADPTDKGKVTFDNAPLIWASTPKSFLDIQFTGTYEFEFDGTNWNCTMYNVAQVSTSLPQIIYAQTVLLGDMVSTDQLFTVTIPLVVGADYRVIGNLISNGAGFDADNDVMFVIASKTSTSFGVGIRRIGGGPQNFKFDFILVK